MAAGDAADLRGAVQASGLFFPLYRLVDRG